jgi:glutamate/tyrosine decarboxylase-like PLP-dependent enzyme
LPAALAADWLESTWDQNAAVYAMSPMASAIEDITASWLREIAHLPPGMSVGFVTGCQMYRKLSGEFRVTVRER